MKVAKTKPTELTGLRRRHSSSWLRRHTAMNGRRPDFMEDEMQVPLPFSSWSDFCKGFVIALIIALSFYVIFGIIHALMG